MTQNYTPPVPVGEITTQYADQISWLISYATNQAEGFYLSDETVWDTQLDSLSVMIDPLDPVALSEPFSRANVNLLYEKAVVESGGIVGDLIGLSHQGDYLSMLERAYRARHMGRIRRQAHSSARLAGHGHSQGVFARIRRYAQDAIYAGNLGLVDTSGDVFDVHALAAAENEAMGRT